MKIAISIDSACDLPKEIIEKNHIFVKPFFVQLGDKELVDDGLKSEDLFSFVKQSGSLPKTAAPSIESFKEYFEDILKFYDAVIHITISKEMSSANSNATLASAEMENVFVVDSKSLSSGIALVVLSCLKKVEQGKQPKQIVEELEKETSRVQASFLIDTLKYLYKGGRCSSLAMISAKLLMIKPKILVSNGKMGVSKKYMGGLKGCLLKYVEDTLKQNNPDKTVAFCTHSTPMEISSQICARLKEFGFEQVYDCLASSTISTHCGPNTLGILFMNKED